MALLQILKVWDYVPEGSLPQLLRRLEAAYRTYSPGYLLRCRALPIKRTGGSSSHSPRSWSPDADFIWYSEPAQLLDAPDIEDPARVQNTIKSLHVTLATPPLS